MDFREAVIIAGMLQSSAASLRCKTVNTGNPPPTPPPTPCTKNTNKHQRIIGRWRKECTYRAEVEALPGPQSPDLKRTEAGERGKEAFIFNA